MQRCGFIKSTAVTRRSLIIQAVEAAAQKIQTGNKIFLASQNTRLYIVLPVVNIVKILQSNESIQESMSATPGIERKTAISA